MSKDKNPAPPKPPIAPVKGKVALTAPQFAYLLRKAKKRRLGV